MFACFASFAFFFFFFFFFFFLTFAPSLRLTATFILHRGVSIKLPFFPSPLYISSPSPYHRYFSLLSLPLLHYFTSYLYTSCERPVGVYYVVVVHHPSIMTSPDFDLDASPIPRSREENQERYVHQDILKKLSIIILINYLQCLYRGLSSQRPQPRCPSGIRQQSIHAAPETHR